MSRANGIRELVIKSFTAPRRYYDRCVTGPPDQRTDAEEGRPWPLTRRQALAAALAGGAATVIAACGGGDDQKGTVAAEAGTQPLDPTPSCGADGATPEQTEGPFFTPDSPERTSLLEPGLAGTALVLRGRVLDTSCRPIPGALVDFWQADDAGEYDNSGYRLRGHQFSDADGVYVLRTIVPGLYSGRTRHIHVKGQSRGGPVLTTQLYFPDEPANEADGIFDPLLLMDLTDAGAGKRARFDFVLERA
jgi:protocatechuate 3,4-dioxygenase beta subunit